MCVCYGRFCEEDIDQILERRTQVIQLESEGKGSTFSKVCMYDFCIVKPVFSVLQASFVADDSTDISIDDPDFWEKWAKKAHLDLDQLANKVCCLILFTGLLVLSHVSLAHYHLSPSLPSFLQDNLVLDTPRVRKQVRRYGNDSTEIVDMDDGQDDYIDLVPSRGKRGWTKLECLKTEKGLLTNG